jgi:hypothetical protein
LELYRKRVLASVSDNFWIRADSNYSYVFRIYLRKEVKEDIMTEQYKPIYLPTMINIKLTDKEREMLATTYCGMQWLLENVDAGMGTAVAEGYETLGYVQRSVLSILENDQNRK